MTTSDTALDQYVREAVQIMASTLGPIVANDLLECGIVKYRAGDGSERPVSTLQSGKDASDLLDAMTNSWRDCLEDRFKGLRGYHGQQVRQSVYNVKAIRNYYVGEHRNHSCDYDHIEAIGEIGRLVAAYSDGDAVERIQRLKVLAGKLLYGLSTLEQHLGIEAGENVVLLPAVLSQTGEVRQLLDPRRDNGETNVDYGEDSTSPLVVDIPVSDVQDQFEDPGPADQSSQRGSPSSGDSAEDTSTVRRQTQRIPTAEFYIRRGDSFWELKEDDAALVEYESALELDSGSILAHYGAGRCYARKKDYDQAVTSLTCAIENDPEFAGAYGVRGLVYLARGEEDVAERDFDMAMKLSEENVHAYFGKGRIHQNRREFDLAIAMYDKASRLSPDAAHIHRRRGQSCRRQGDMEQAIVSFKRVTDLQPERIQGWRTLAQTCDEARDTEGAIEAYRSLVRLDEDDVEGWSELGRLNYNCQNYHEAVDCLQKSIDLDSSTGFTHLLLGKSCEAVGETGQARENYQQAIEIDETDCDALVALGRIYAEDENNEQASELFWQAANLGPQMPHQKAELAGGFLFIGEYTEAIEGYRDALDMWDMFSHLGTVYFVSPDEQVYAWNNLGVAHFDNGDVDESISCYWEDVELWQRLHEVYGTSIGEDGSLDPGSLFMALNNLVIACERTGDYRRAIDGLDRAIMLSPDSQDLLQLRDQIVRYLEELTELNEEINRAPGDPENWCLRALFYRKHEDFDRAIANLNKALDLGPVRNLAGEIFNELGLIHMRLENYDQAMEDYYRAIANKSDFSEAYYNRGILWRRLGHLSDARADFEMAIAFNGEYAEAHQNLGYLKLSLANSEEAQEHFDQARRLGLELSPGSE